MELPRFPNAETVLRDLDEVSRSVVSSFVGDLASSAASSDFCARYGPDMTAEVLADLLSAVIADETHLDRAVLTLLSGLPDSDVAIVLSHSGFMRISGF